MSRSGGLALALLLLTLNARADDLAAPTRHLQLPLALGGHPGFWGPSPSTANLGAHIRGTVMMGADSAESSALALRWGLGASASLWRWAEAGVRFSGRWDLDARTHFAGPVEIWLRAGPPDLRGIALQAVLEQATARAGFDDGDQLWPMTTNIGAALAVTRGRFHGALSATYERGVEDRGPAHYDGMRASAGAWLMVVKAGEYLGLEIGGDALVRVGGEEGPRGPLGLAGIFTIGVRLVDETGAAFRAGYGQGFGRGMPARFGVVGIGYSWGKGYVRPAHDPTYPPLLPDLTIWWAERQAVRRAAQDFRLAQVRHLEQLRGPASVCQLPSAILPWQVLRSCVVAGARFEYSPPAGEIITSTITVPTPPPRPGCDLCRPDPMPDYSPGGAGYYAACALLRLVRCDEKPWDPRASSPPPPRPGGFLGSMRRPQVAPVPPAQGTAAHGPRAPRAAQPPAPAPQTAEHALPPYQRPPHATNRAQKRSVNDPPNQPCIDCGKTAPRMVADHKTPLVVEHYSTGAIDRAKMRSVDAVQPQCPTCSAKQGARLKVWAAEKKKGQP